VGRSTRSPGVIVLVQSPHNSAQCACPFCILWSCTLVLFGVFPAYLLSGDRAEELTLYFRHQGKTLTDR
jgi:hypothetical protein